jgi:primosomal protein N'
MYGIYRKVKSSSEPVEFNLPVGTEILVNGSHDPHTGELIVVDADTLIHYGMTMERLIESWELLPCVR